MAQNAINKCPVCEANLRMELAVDGVSMNCPNDHFRQNIQTEEVLGKLAQDLTEWLEEKGFDTVHIQGHDIEARIAFRYNALLPYMIKAGHVVLPVTTDFIKVVRDKHGLQRARAYLVANATIPEYEKIFKLFSDMLEPLIYSASARIGVENGVIMLEHIEKIITNIKKERGETTDFDSKINKSIEAECVEVVDDKVDTDVLMGVKVIHSFSAVHSDGAMIGQIRTMQRDGVKFSHTPDVARISEVLKQEFPWFEKVIEMITSELLVRTMSQNEFRIQPILMLGEPGVGKTAFCARLGELAGVPYTIMSLAGSTSNQVLAGTDRGWSTAKPSLPLQTMMQTGMANPLIVLDELDKAGGSEQNGRVSDTLLGMLEPSSSKKWFDPYAMGLIDLSHINWIATANDISQMPRTLLSRMQVVRVDGPETSHYPAIVWTARRQFIQEYGLSEYVVPYFSDGEWAWLEQYYTSPRVVRKATEHLLRSRISKPLTGVLH